MSSFLTFSSQTTMASELTIQTRLQLFQSEGLLPQPRTPRLPHEAQGLLQELELALPQESLQRLCGSSSGILSTRCLTPFEQYLNHLLEPRRRVSTEHHEPPP